MSIGGLAGLRHGCLCAQSVETPVDVVPEGVATMLSDFLQGKDPAAVAAFAGDLIGALFEGVPETSNGKEVPAKTKVTCDASPV